MRQCTKLVLLILFCSFQTFAEEKWVTVDGFGPLDAGKPVARRQALVEAYRQAISEGGMVEVGGYSQMSNFAMVADVVKTKVHGYIKTYQVVSEGEDPSDKDMYKVTIKAQVVTTLDKGGEQGLAAFVDMIGTPKVLFLLSDNDPQQKASSTESYFAEGFSKVGYKVFTGDDVKIKGDVTKELLASARAGDGQAAAIIGRAANADLVLTGLLKVEMSSMSGGTDVQAQIGNVNLSVKALIPGNGNVIDVANARDRYMSIQQASAMIAREKAVQKAATRITEKLKWQIPEYLAKQPRVISLKLHNLAFESVDPVTELLDEISGIEDVEMVNWDEEIAEFNVSSGYTGPKEGDLVKVLKGVHASAKVKSFKNYQLEMDLNIQ